MADLFMTGADPDEVWPLVRDFHYSRRMPSNVQHCFAWRVPGGLFGDTGIPKAGIVYGIGANYTWPNDCLELQRLVRHPGFDCSLSEFVAWSLRWLRKNSPCPFVYSYADPSEGHHGGIYQASGFIFVGQSKETRSGFLLPSGEKIHRKTARDRIRGAKSDKDVRALRPDWVPLRTEPKYLYVKPLRQQLGPLMKRFGWTQLPYPKPNAARPADAPVPSGASKVQPLGAAPITADARA